MDHATVHTYLNTFKLQVSFIISFALPSTALPLVARAPVVEHLIRLRAEELAAAALIFLVATATFLALK